MPQPPSWIVYGGLVLGTLGFLLSLRNWVKDRPRLQVSVEFDTERGELYSNSSLVVVRLNNAGRRPVCIERLAILPTRPGQEPLLIKEGKGATLTEGSEPTLLYFSQQKVWSHCDGRWWKVKVEARTTDGARRVSPPVLVAPHGRRPAQGARPWLGSPAMPEDPGYGAVLMPSFTERAGRRLNAILHASWPL